MRERFINGLRVSLRVVATHTGVAHTTLWNVFCREPKDYFYRIQMSTALEEAQKESKPLSA